MRKIFYFIAALLFVSCINDLDNISNSIEEVDSIVDIVDTAIEISYETEEEWLQHYYDTLGSWNNYDTMGLIY